MKTKPKRIRAQVNRGITPDRDMYVLWRGDIRALAEQMEDAWLRRCCEMVGMKPSDFKHDREMRVAGLLYALKRAGITPGKGAK